MATMTVRVLRERLAECDPDIPVYYGKPCGITDVEDIAHITEICNSDEWEHHVCLYNDDTK